MAYSGVIALFSSCLLWFTTHLGVGTAPDSLAYLLFADSMEQPFDVLAFTNHWPPLYPFVLALVKQATGDIWSAARLLHCTLYGLNIFLFAIWVENRTAGSNWPGTWGILALAIAPPAFLLHYMALSEALFCTFLITYLILSDRYILSSAISKLYAAALVLGLLILTRYAGMAFVLAGGLYLLTEPDKTPGARFLNMSLFCALSAVLPLTWWIMSSSVVGQGETPRELAYHPIDLWRLKQFIEVPMRWLNPQILTINGTRILCLVILATLFWGSLGENARSAQRVRLLLLTIIVYCAFLIAAISLFDYYIVIDKRTLLPVFLLLLGALVLSVQQLLRRSPSIGFSVLLLLFVPVISWLPERTTLATSISQNGSGYFSRQFRSQEILDYLSQIASLPEAYSNTPETLQLYLNQRARELPRLINPTTRELRADYVEELEDMKAKVLAGQAVVVYLHRFEFRQYYPDRLVLETGLELPLIHETSDGAIYGINEVLLK